MTQAAQHTPAPAADVDSFLRRFHRFGATPSVDTYLALFHPDATLFDDGMERPLTVDEIPAHIEGVLAMAPGFRMTPERWRARDAAVFVEARNVAAPGGAPVAWRAVYRVDLRGDQVLRGRRYFDRAALLAHLMPDAVPPAWTVETAAVEAEAPQVGAAAFVDACAKAWADGRPQAIAARYRDDGALHTPVTAPLGRASVAAFYERLAPLALAPRAWAGDDDLLFIEWEGRRGFACVERFDLRDGLVLSGRLYCDSLALQRGLEDA
jgi:ketosteroid isomerase-like protein